ncbi:hypothetical protein N0V93_004665 [Gnomoniopsis smithogilvyi]|uniref:Uncharacterized protein n=1 Tax=Gnomoniopsis smithogilvyi TaxID=1191159 RepID=A0A9W8YT06_9PEZI|nr:hypothetical protein N0V93_004665 [Gnomoniopsis smithogilvyi]
MRSNHKLNDNKQFLLCNSFGTMKLLFLSLLSVASLSSTLALPAPPSFEQPTVKPHVVELLEDPVARSIELPTVVPHVVKLPNDPVNPIVGLDPIVKDTIDQRL